MEFKELEKKVLHRADEYSKRYKIKIDEDFALLKLYEEVGEFAQEILIHRRKSRPEKHRSKKETKQKVAAELADIIGLIMVNAKLLKIDLEEAIIKKWLTREWIKKSKN